MREFYVTLDKIVDQLDLEVLYSPGKISECKITSADVNRPGLLLTGFHDYFDPTRIQIIGRMEMSYLAGISDAERRHRFNTLFQYKVPVVIITHSMEAPEEILEFAKEYGVPVLRTAENTSSIMSAIISMLSVELAPRITRHGVLVDVYGEGILILGESGVGKSETAVELVKRGHRLIADDAVELRRVSKKSIVGTSPENIRHFVELRGIGIVNVAKVFGIGAVKPSGNIDMVVELQQWEAQKNYSRTGLENETIEILGVELPLAVIPVRPGRNLAIILETAAINNRQKKMGYNAAQELLSQLGLEEDIK